MLVNTHNPCIDKAFPVFSVSVIVGDFLRFPMSRGHKLGHKLRALHWVRGSVKVRGGYTRSFDSCTQRGRETGPFLCSDVALLTPTTLHPVMTPETND